MKICIGCFEQKPQDDFYNRSNRCKVCTCRQVKANRESKREQYSAYDQSRNQTPERRQKALEYQRTRRAASPEKHDARQAIMWAVRRGWIKPQPCETCGSMEKLEAHHDDYSKPLQVRWFCFKHHREVGHGQVVVAV